MVAHDRPPLLTRPPDAVAPTGVALGPGLHVLDLGPGTEDRSRVLADRVDAGGARGGWVLGVDPALDRRSAVSRPPRPGLAFVAARLQDVGSLLPPGTLDVVVAARSLPSSPVEDQVGAVRGLAEMLTPGGVLHADLTGPAPGTPVPELLAPLAAVAGIPARPWFLPTALAAGTLLVRAGLRVEMVRARRRRRVVPDAAAMREWLVEQVLPAYVEHLRASDRDAFERAALTRCVPGARRVDGGYDRDEVQLELLARRPLAGPDVSYPDQDVVLADVLAAVARLIERVDRTHGLGEDEKALLSKRFRRATAAVRHEPTAALQALGVLYEELWTAGAMATWGR